MRARAVEYGNSDLSLSGVVERSKLIDRFGVADYKVRTCAAPSGFGDVDRQGASGGSHGADLAIQENHPAFGAWRELKLSKPLGCFRIVGAEAVDGVCDPLGDSIVGMRETEDDAGLEHDKSQTDHQNSKHEEPQKEGRPDQDESPSRVSAEATIQRIEVGRTPPLLLSGRKPRIVPRALRPACWL